MNAVHHHLVFKRRVAVLSAEIGRLLPEGARVLDVGCGSGDIAAAVQVLRPDVTIDGVDVLVRPGTAISVREYDGVTLPEPDASYDVVMMIDVLHHTDDPTLILREAARVGKQGVLVKDHFRDGLFAEETLRLMDWAGNAAHGVRLPYNYLSRKEWYRAWKMLQLHPKNISSKIELYPFPLNLLFGRELHFIAFLERNSVDDLTAGILPD